ncbi:MAG: C40 family peptidase [Gaiellaceae bacterium]
MRRSAVTAACILVCAACAAGLLALAGAHAVAAAPRSARTTHHAAALHVRQRAAQLRRVRLVAARRRARNQIVMLAWRAVGVPYRWGGASPRGGFDCSGLTRWVYGRAGISLPHYAAAQWRYGRRVFRRALAPGDLIFFSGLGHVGIYLGHGAVIHAPRPRARVRFERLRGWLASSFYGARRLRLAG